jgi:hypothetical protein
MHARLSPRSRRRTRAGLAGLLVAALAFAACGGDSDAGAPQSTKPENVAFYYLPIRDQADVDKVGPVQLIVAGQGNSRRGGADIVDMIHETGAKAYIYEQTYWFPQDRGHQGLNMGRHPDWSFCTDGEEPLTVERADGEPWVFLDMNERAVQQYLTNQFRAMKEAGWDGIFFDRGGVALGALEQDPEIWYERSTCTEQPVRPDATFADTWIDVSGIVKSLGMDLIVNYGLSPFDPDHPMRPDPNDENCIARTQPCRVLDDGWTHPTWVLDEAVAHPRDINWDKDFQANRQNEQDAAHPRQVIGLITVGTLGGDLSRQNVFFEWARTKLFDFPLGVAVWDRGKACPDVQEGEACRSLVTYPELTSIVLGSPVDDQPQSAQCGGGEPNCVWSRRYQQGAMVVNVQDRPVSGFELELGTDGCRYVNDVWSGRELAGGECVDSVTIDLPAWTGRPLSYSTSAR